MLTLSRRKLTGTILLFTTVVFAAFTDATRASDVSLAPNQAMIVAVANGKQDVANASWWGFDPGDSTAALQAALNSPAKTIIIENLERPWIVTTIRLPSDKQIVFQPGTVVQAKRGSFLGKGDCLFLAENIKNLTIQGQGSTWSMHKADYHQPPYELAEWRHALSIRGCSDVTVTDLTLRDSGGDGVYLGAGQGGAANRNITLRGLTCRGNNRQGISVITAENLLIEDCVFADTSGTAPQAGIDFEPNRPSELLTNCVLRNCRSVGNAGHGYHLYLGQMNADSKPISIRFENCSSSNNQGFSTYLGIANREGRRCLHGSIEYINCQFDADEGGAVYVRGNEADGCRVRFCQCKIIRRDTKADSPAPITVEGPRQLDIQTGNIELDQVTIKDSLERQPLRIAASPLTRLGNLTGSLIVNSPQGQNEYRLTPEQISEWYPSLGKVRDINEFAFDWQDARIAAPGDQRATHAIPVQLRGEALLLLWGEAGVPLQVAAELRPVGRSTINTGKMSWRIAGTSQKLLKPLQRDNGVEYSINPSSTGPIYLHWQSNSTTTFTLKSCSTPVSLLSGPQGIHLFRPRCRLYFSIPAGVTRFAIQVAGSGTAETVRATVFDAAGKQVDACDNIALPHVFVLDRPDGAAAETWFLELSRASEGVLEDVTLHVMGIPQLFAASPDDLMISTASH